MNKRLNAKTIVYLTMVIILLGIFSGCSNKFINTNEDGSVASFSSISPEEVKKRLDSGDGIILLDVRTIEEYESGHIEGAILISVDNLKEEAEKKLEDKEIPIFVYCRSGNRSTTASNILVSLGYKNVYNLGGINDWPYEVVK